MTFLIKGMEMPTSCAFCRFYGAYCYAKGDEDAHSTSPCPLVPVPPHGRLIDESEFFLRLDDGIKTISSLALPEDFVAVYTQLVKEVKEEIGKCRTIIPASENK